MPLCFGTSWPMALADVWGDGVRSPCPSCSFVLTESGPACSGSVALAVPCHCALLDGGSLWMWEQKSHTQWSVGSHLTENIISIQSCSCCGSQRLSLLECFQGKQGNWIQSGAKIGELQDTDFLRWCFPLCGHTRYHAWIQGVLEMKEPWELWACEKFQVWCLS